MDRVDPEDGRSGSETWTASTRKTVEVDPEGPGRRLRGWTTWTPWMVEMEHLDSGWSSWWWSSSEG